MNFPGLFIENSRPVPHNPQISCISDYKDEAPVSSLKKRKTSQAFHQEIKVNLEEMNPLGVEEQDYIDSTQRTQAQLQSTDLSSSHRKNIKIIIRNCIDS